MVLDRRKLASFIPIYPSLSLLRQHVSAFPVRSYSCAGAPSLPAHQTGFTCSAAALASTRQRWLKEERKKKEKRERKIFELTQIPFSHLRSIGRSSKHQRLVSAAV
ncbi:hypothetical protein MHYP_G00076140 [Metynnis hypsauchen]